MARFDFDVAAFDELQQAMRNYQGNTERAINDVLHNQASRLFQDSIKNLIPESKRDWRGKKKAAAKSKSLTDEKSNLAITVKSKTAYNYLYFPDDGTNTYLHAGNKQFFRRGVEAKQSEVADLCIRRLTDDFGT